MAEKKIENINLGISTRQKFTIDGDRDRVIYLDTHDLGLVNRLSESVKQMDELQEEWEKLDALNDVDSENINDVDDDSLRKSITDFSEQFKSIETKMRGIIEYIFDCPGLCDTVLGNSSVFSPVNGNYKFEQIIDVLSGLYEDSIEREAKKINKRTVEKKTSKYIRNAK